MFFLLLFCLHLTLTARAYKYASSLSLEELVRTTPKALEPMPWPNDAFVIVVEPRNEQDMINMTPALIYVVYRGNDTTVPRLSEVTITPPESVHAVMKDLCTSAGFSGADFFACMGAEVRDAVSNTVYGQPYSPMKPTATIHDFKARRYNVISWLITRMLYTSYLEIGCDSGQSFQVIVQATEGILTDAVCVDPDEKTGATLHMTSDAFFASLQKASGPPATVTGGPDADAAGARSGSRGGGNGTTTFDVVFVDGLHEANQAYRDVMHAWHALRPGGTILMHDVNPPHEYMATYPMHQVCEGYNWHGDVWKAVVALRGMHNAEVVTLDVDTGIAVVRKRPNLHPLSARWREELGPNPISMLKWEHLEAHREELLRLVTLQEFRDWLDEETVIPADPDVVHVDVSPQ